jgi:hypothetical protein
VSGAVPSVRSRCLTSLRITLALPHRGHHRLDIDDVNPLASPSNAIAHQHDVGFFHFVRLPLQS